MPHKSDRSMSENYMGTPSAADIRFLQRKLSLAHNLFEAARDLIDECPDCTHPTRKCEAHAALRKRINKFKAVG